MGIGAADRMIYPCLVLLLAGWLSLREYAVVERAGFPNEADSLALSLRDKLNYFSHIHSKR